MFDTNMLDNLNKMQMYVDCMKVMINSNGITENERETLKEFLRRLKQCTLVSNLLKI